MPAVGAFAQVHQDLVADAAAGVGGQLDAAGRGEGVYRLDQPDGANAYQVLGGHTAVFVLFGQIHHQSQVVGDQLLAGGSVPGSHAVKQGFFLLGGKGRGQAWPARQIMHRAAVAQTPPQPLPDLAEKLQHGYPSCALFIICIIRKLHQGGLNPLSHGLRRAGSPKGGAFLP